MSKEEVTTSAMNDLVNMPNQEETSFPSARLSNLISVQSEEFLKDSSSVLEKLTAIEVTLSEIGIGVLPSVEKNKEAVPSRSPRDLTELDQFSGVYAPSVQAANSLEANLSRLTEIDERCESIMKALSFHTKIVR